jgi:hypothetical protein
MKLRGMGQMIFTQYLVVVDDDVNVHNTSEVLFWLCANTDPQRDSIFTKGPSDVLDHACLPAGRPPAKSPAAASWALTRRRKSLAKASNAPGRPSSR